MRKSITTNEEIAQVFLQNQRTLFLIALNYSESIDTAEEIVSDTIVVALEANKSFSCEAACVGYMKAIVRNQAISRLRRKYEIEPEEGESIERYMVEHNECNLPFREVEVQMLLQELLAEYPKEMREAFVAYVLDQEPIPRLARQYGIKADTLRKKIYRLKEQIAQTVPEKDMRAILFMLLLYS